MAEYSFRGGDCKLPVVLDHAGLPRGSCPDSVMPEIELGGVGDKLQSW